MRGTIAADVRVDEFDYALPQEFIAQEPLVPRDASRLMLVDRQTGAISHHRFHELPELLAPGDLLVLNDTRVIAARLIGHKQTGGRVELLLVERVGGPDAEPEWECLLQASRAPAEGARLRFGGSLVGEVVGRSGTRWTVRLTDADGDPMRAVDRWGQLPLPPYIRRAEGDPRGPGDRLRYQTVYARHPGAVAAPTAGLHFTERLLEALAQRGIGLAFVTLHVGLGTFAPVRVEQVDEHVMPGEWFSVTPETAAAAEAAQRRGGRVVAVGSTVVRTLEHMATESGTIRCGTGRCALFIRPGHRFRVVDALITNFHLPRSTPLILVSAFGGTATILSAYREAIRAGYRFYSYGDAMMVGSAP
jgi:S-adenosylmethionine:tRNA ribosyltransferase-isomerase